MGPAKIDKFKMANRRDHQCFLCNSKKIYVASFCQLPGSKIIAILYSIETIFFHRFSLINVIYNSTAFAFEYIYKIKKQCKRGVQLYANKVVYVLRCSQVLRITLQKLIKMLNVN